MFKRALEEATAESRLYSDLNIPCLSNRSTSSQQSGDLGLVKKRLLSDDDRQQRCSPTINYGSHQVIRSRDERDKSANCRDTTPDKYHVEGAHGKYVGASELDEGLTCKSYDKELADSQQITNPGKHLVKTLADLPKFVTIEGYRVASYTLDGESLLCLPHLLQYIQHKYPLDKVIEIFEKTVTNFNSATPKQVEGFVKAIVLPPNATECPLIRRSDAERVCLTLYDHCSLDQTSDDDCKTSKFVQETHSKNDRSQSIVTVPIDAQSRNKETYPNSNQRDTSNTVSKEKDIHQAHNEHLNRRSVSATGVGNELPIYKKDGAPIQAQNITQQNTELGRSKQSPKNERPPIYAHQNLSTSLDSDNRSSDETSSGSQSNQIFGTEDHSTFLDLARAVTSTLMIKVYHRCFGKCNGLYYPIKLKHSESRCIECSECHRLFSPRRFIGHTHKHREENVCHWGFNSYLWRHYIYLCRNQDMNDLDDDELLVQLDILKAIPERDPCKSEIGDIPKVVESTQSNNLVISNHDKPNHIKTHRANSNVSSRNPTDDATLDVRLNANQSIQPINIVKPTIFEPSTSSAGTASTSKPENLMGKQRSDHHRSTFTWPASQSSATPSAGASFKITNEQNTHMTNTFLNSTVPFPLTDLLANPLFFSHIQKSIPTNTRMTLSDFNLPHLGSLEAAPSARTSLATPNSSSYHSSTAEGLIKQDMFISSSMAAYLSSRCLDGDMIRDIIAQTLDTIRKSRMLFQ